jgi:hypothetical protein
MNTGKNSALTLLAVVIAVTLLAADLPKGNYKPKEGYVPDKETAIKIAVAIWTPIYGEKLVQSEKPYHAVLSNGVWFVRGWTLDLYGDAAVAEISKDDGRILRVSYGQWASINLVQPTTIRFAAGGGWPWSMIWLREVNGETLLASGVIILFSPSLVRIDPAGQRPRALLLLDGAYADIRAFNSSALLLSIAARFAL